MSDKFTADCKPLPPPADKSLIYGSGGGTRTPDTRIMISRVLLKFLEDFVNCDRTGPREVNHLPAWCKPEWMGAMVLVGHEARGHFIALPHYQAMYHTGGTWLQAWLLLCVALSIVVPLVIWRRMR